MNRHPLVKGGCGHSDREIYESGLCVLWTFGALIGTGVLSVIMICALAV